MWIGGRRIGLGREGFGLGVLRSRVEREAASRRLFVGDHRATENNDEIGFDVSIL